MIEGHVGTDLATKIYTKRYLPVRDKPGRHRRWDLADNQRKCRLCSLDETRTKGLHCAKKREMLKNK